MHPRGHFETRRLRHSSSTQTKRERGARTPLATACSLMSGAAEAPDASRFLVPHLSHTRGERVEERCYVQYWTVDRSLAWLMSEPTFNRGLR